MINLETATYALFGGILPALVWLVFWLREDKKNPEPKKLILRTFLFGMGAVMIVLFFQKRKIFPKLAIFYLLANLVFVVGDTLVAGLIPFVAQQDNSSSMKEIFRSVVGAGVWVPYFLTSKRVKGTFVR